MVSLKAKFEGVPFIWGVHAKFEVAGFIYHINISESVFNRQNRRLSHPSGELRVTYGLHL